jgi:hypothetical protein
MKSFQEFEESLSNYNKHKVQVTASKDGGPKQKINVKVFANSEAEAKGKARLHLKSKGYETHSATHHGIDYDWVKKEEVEQINELSKETLTSYIDKAADPKTASRGKTQKGILKSIKAIGGVAKAIGKRAKQQMEEGKKPGSLGVGWMLKKDPKLASIIAAKKEKMKSFKQHVGSKIEDNKDKK